MRYFTGDEGLVGDRVNAFGSTGVVVYVVDTQQGSEKYPSGAWDYLMTGLMIETDEMGLVHYPEPDEGVTLIARANA